MCLVPVSSKCPQCVSRLYNVITNHCFQARDQSDQYREPLERNESTRSKTRKSSVTPSEADAQRHRDWAPDRSPLQRLELTLDGITKEEKRAQAEEAELVAREQKAGRGGERANQNSVNYSVAFTAEVAMLSPFAPESAVLNNVNIANHSA